MNYLRGSVEATICDFGIVIGKIVSVSSKEITLDVQEIVSPCYPNTVLPYGLLVFPVEDIENLEEVPELKFFLVNWYDSELDDEDSEIVEARTVADAVVLIGEGNIYALDIVAEEYQETFDIVA